MATGLMGNITLPGLPEIPAFVFFGIGWLIAIIITVIMCVMLTNVYSSDIGYPPWFDYDQTKGNHRSLREYLQKNNLDPTKINITELQVATANFGGIKTDVKAQGAVLCWPTPWHGTVTSEAARLQVDAGARAIVFDIWPDPSHHTTPIIACMMDMNSGNRNIESWWADRGLKSYGTQSTYSNWKRLTRKNMESTGDILKTAVGEAFADNNIQSEDPFFLILNLHGVLSEPYLNNLAEIIHNATDGKRYHPHANMSPRLCDNTVDKIFGKVMIIMNPDIPDNMDRATLNDMYWKPGTRIANVTNVLTGTEHKIVFRPSEIGEITSGKYTDCNGSGSKPLPVSTLCCVQPSIGGIYTDNDTIFKPSNFQNCMATGAQFVAVNVFGAGPTGTGSASGNSAGDQDSTLQAWLDPSNFGKYSFKYKKLAKKPTTK